MKKFSIRLLSVTLTFALLLSGCAGGKQEAPEDWATGSVRFWVSPSW